MPEFRPPPPPQGIDTALWPHIAEHVARAERVGEYIRSRGFDAAFERFGTSSHAVELATLAAAAEQGECLSLGLLISLLSCDVDELVAYGSFLDLLHRFRGESGREALAVYERFCEAFAAAAPRSKLGGSWHDRVSLVRDGLAGFYISLGEHDKGHALYLQRHRDDPTTLVVALAASRAFWTEGALGRAILWLELGAERADALGRADMASKLRQKRDTLRNRQS